MFRDSIFSKLNISCFELEKALVFLFNQAFPVIKSWLNVFQDVKFSLRQLVKWYCWVSQTYRMTKLG
jgi:hypothetical protein